VGWGGWRGGGWAVGGGGWGGECCRLLPRITQHSTAQHSTAQHSTAQHSTAPRSTALMLQVPAPQPLQRTRTHPHQAPTPQPPNPPHSPLIPPHLMRRRPQVRHQGLQPDALVADVHEDVVAAVEGAEGQRGDEVGLDGDGQVLQDLVDGLGGWRFGLGLGFGVGVWGWVWVWG